MLSDVPITQGNLAVNGVRAVDLLRQRLDAEELETAALRELLSRRREGDRISAERMDRRLGSMIANKRRTHDLPS